MNPPDWFPEDHAPAPALVQKGHGTALACGACHLMSGEGHPESAGLTGFTAAYLVQQMADSRAAPGRLGAHERHREGRDGRGIGAGRPWFAALKPGRGRR